MTLRFAALLMFVFCARLLPAQLNYSLMEHWAFHPAKSGTLIDGYNLDIAVVDEKLDTKAVLKIPNKAMINTGVDVFFVHPTLLANLGGYATREVLDLADQPPAWNIAASILGQAGLLSKYGRFFAPRYRQATPPTYLGSPLDSTQAAVIAEAYSDVKAAFLHYLDNYNNGNKVILASHSQGAYLTAMLLRDVFDNNAELKSKLVTAVLGGIVSTYASPNEFMGGWWQNIPLCTSMSQCGCVMTWRSYKEGQSIPPVKPATPSLNPRLVGRNLVYRSMNLSSQWVMQDSLFYTSQSAPLRYYLTPKSSQPYGGPVGFIAFDSFYAVRYQRADLTRVGFLVQHTPRPNDLRPNNLLQEEANPLFDVQGYHNRDFNIYGWAVLQQIDRKLASCPTLPASNEPSTANPVLLYPNPTNEILTLRAFRSMSRIEIFNALGQRLHDQNPGTDQYLIAVNRFPKGVLFVKTSFTDGTSWTGRFVKI